ncbi:MAG: 2-oxo acid dehydrogenase subunit E2 [Sediminibacterium sp.]|nr:2-oxo acid dehydrogenase subunit E2 [Sediminibacterium sp.]MBP6144036.1 2-oxo acid dehydrogenase subunit E2 [Sediminibacterium sp.]
MSVVDLILPKLGESIMEATILKWHKAVGDTIQLDETLLDIATDKVDSEIPSTTAGTITEILFEVNAVVPIGTVIARIQTSGSINPASTPISTPAQVIAPVNVPVTNTVVAEEVPFAPTSTPQLVQNLDSNDIRFFSPLVLNIAQNEGISLNELQHIPGTGSQGRVSKKDILQYVANKKAGLVQAPIVAPVIAAPVTPAQQQQQQQQSAPVLQAPTNSQVNQFPPVDYGFSTANNAGKFASPEEVIVTGNTEIIEMDRMRKLIAKHMVDSVQTSPHVTSFVEADVTNMVVWREKVKQLFEKRESTKLTFTPMFMECIAATLEKFPYINCSLQGDNIILKKDINIGMATALPSGNLIVPVIKGANQLSIVGLSKAVNGLANAARNNQLKPQDTQGGTFTVTNVGTFGSIMGTPIIPQPQVAILALGAIKKRPVVIETPAGDAILVRHMMYLSMSYDHRIVDGAMGSSFLSAVAKAFENWDPNRQWFQYV